MAEEEPTKESVPAFAEVGATGLQRAGGFITEEFLNALRGRRAAQIYREMSDNDPIVGGILFSIDKLIRNVKWTVKSDNDEIAEFVDQCRNDMETTWEDLISEIMTMLPYGWSLFELVYKRRMGDEPPPRMQNGKAVAQLPSKFDDGRIGWGKIASRSQDSLYRWGIDDTGSITGMYQNPAPDYRVRFIPIEKALLFRTSTNKNNPEGRSILRNAYRPWYFKKRIEEIESIGIERDLAGFPVLWLDNQIMSSQKPEDQAIVEDYKSIIRNIRRDKQEGLVIPLYFDEASGNRLIELELLSSGGSRTFDTSGIIGRYQSEIAMSVLADFILLGHESVGSFALSADKTELFAVALGSWLKSIAAMFTNVAIPQLLRLNNMPTDANTELVPGDIDEIPVEIIVQLLTAMDAMGAAVFPNDKVVEYLFGRVGLPFTDDALAVKEEPEPEPQPPTFPQPDDE